MTLLPLELPQVNIVQLHLESRMLQLSLLEATRQGSQRNKSCNSLQRSVETARNSLIQMKLLPSVVMLGIVEELKFGWSCHLEVLFGAELSWYEKFSFIELHKAFIWSLLETNLKFLSKSFYQTAKHQAQTILWLTLNEHVFFPFSLSNLHSCLFVDLVCVMIETLHGRARLKSSS